MAVVKIINRYEIRKKDGKWTVTTTNGEHMAGPFDSEQMATDVASVFTDTPASPKRRGKDQD
ncbi:hypothetical protein JFT91_17375 [Pseudomonas sp. TH08]|uniref:hypothetical protein n=1 Tax=unclassified Pseudomonas TaxID=196821 RepID=UPI001911F1D4|nr:MULTISPECIES: hypothetical protein [unclassified Pseudomonas]MBK5512247.1 hypothetical protein [Pseudomonas sp. TH15]MBK5534348.1 hypothetical protein [Pseudomonas sp. TH08]